MELLSFLRENWLELLVLTREHIFLVLFSTGLAVLAGLPLGIVLTRIKSLRTPVLGFANVMQTVPSLALFGLLADNRRNGVTTVFSSHDRKLIEAADKALLLAQGRVARFRPIASGPARIAADIQRERA